MIPTFLYKYIAGLALVLVAALGGFFYGHHVSSQSWELKAAQAQAAAQARVLQWQRQNSALSAAEAAKQAKIADLQTQITQQLPKMERIYVKVPGKTITRVVSRTVYVSRGLVWLYNASLGLSGTTASGQPDDGSQVLSSAVRLDDYFSTSLSNNGACLANTTQLTLLQAWVRGLK